MPQHIRVQMFGTEIEVPNSFSFRPPGGCDSLSSSVARLSGNFYLNAFFTPAQLKDGVHGLLARSAEERKHVNLDEFLGERQGLRTLDPEYGDSYLVGVLIATVSASSANKNLTERFVIYAPNLVNKSGKYAAHDKSNPNAEIKGQTHFEQISTQQLWDFLDLAKKQGGKAFEKLWPTLTVELEYYFKSGGNTNTVCDACTAVINRFLRAYSGWSNMQHKSPGLVVSKRTASGPVWIVPDHVTCSACKRSINFGKREASEKAEYGPENSVYATLKCPHCQASFNVKRELESKTS